MRNKTSLIQTFGRAARNSEGRVIMYADNTTVSMKSALQETKRRREKQIQYNKTNKIIPKTIIKSIPEQETELDEIKNKSKTDLKKQKIEIEIKMKAFAEDLDFENAIQCRDKIKRIQMELNKDESK
uniref:Excinuclease helicase subunit (UvrB) n=1 Tax=uncultured marine thaumarchaeote KM3_62_E02 TaxID=1456216 RepID=A0A075HGC6_9ARCH|nr:excinuclease helicase subunit (uvrB) [uncultured marine thaumarchaeote KM3_62_E02]